MNAKRTRRSVKTNVINAQYLWLRDFRFTNDDIIYRPLKPPSGHRTGRSDAKAHVSRTIANVLETINGKHHLASPSPRPIDVARQNTVVTTQHLDQ
jgi:hypothetical protein